MKITKSIINDLFPLYLANECSSDSRALVEEYLHANPVEADELRRIMNTSALTTPLPPASLDELRSFREARRRLRRRTWLCAFAIFFSLVPFSFFFNGEKTWWLFLAAPKSALAYGALGVVCWIAYAVERTRSRSL